jgi:hypothetical protein
MSHTAAPNGFPPTPCYVKAAQRYVCKSKEGTISCSFATLNAVEPPIFARSLALILERDEPWHAQRLQALEKTIRQRLEG